MHKLHCWDVTFRLRAERWNSNSVHLIRCNLVLVKMGISVRLKAKCISAKLLKTYTSSHKCTLSTSSYANINTKLIHKKLATSSVSYSNRKVPRFKILGIEQSTVLVLHFFVRGSAAQPVYHAVFHDRRDSGREAVQATVCQHMG